MTETVAPAITALFGSVIRPVSDASADCASSVPRSRTPSITPRTNLRMDTPVRFSQVVRYHPEISSSAREPKTTISQSGGERKSLRPPDPVDTADIADLYQPQHVFAGGKKGFCLEKRLQSVVSFLARLAEAR